MSQKHEEVRHQLGMLARSRKTRVTVWTRSMPTDWRPYQVKNPSTGDFFTEEGAWQLIVELLDGGCDLEEIILDVPPGKKAYVMIVELGAESPPLYIKLQLGSGKVIGRSFHLSAIKKNPRTRPAR